MAHLAAVPDPAPYPPERITSRAACRGMPVSVFFPEPPSHGAIQQAKAVCAACEVRAECAAWAIPQTDLAGIFGGLSASERRRLRRGRRRGAPPAHAAPVPVAPRHPHSAAPH